MSKKRKRHEHYCWVCGRHRPNEKFSGKGHRNHICKECSKRPKEQLTEIERTQELLGYWDQKNISKKNINRISALSKATNNKIAELAQVILEVAHICPHRKKRIQRISREKKELIPKLEKVGLIYSWVYHDDSHFFVEESELFDGEFNNEIYGYESDDPMSFEYYLYNEEES